MRVFRRGVGSHETERRCPGERPLPRRANVGGGLELWMSQNPHILTFL